MKGRKILEKSGKKKLMSGILGNDYIPTLEQLHQQHKVDPEIKSNNSRKHDLQQDSIILNMRG